MARLVAPSKEYISRIGIQELGTIQGNHSVIQHSSIGAPISDFRVRSTLRYSSSLCLLSCLLNATLIQYTIKLFTMLLLLTF